MSIRISSIRIQNYRNFGDFQLDPFPESAVILGENGVGKSNLLHAIRLCLDPAMSDAQRRLQESDVWSGATATIGEGVVVSVSIELSGYDGDKDAMAVLSRCELPGLPRRAKITYRFGPKAASRAMASAESRPLTLDDYDFEIYGADDEDRDAARVKREIDIRVLGALRDAESDLLNWRRNPLRGLIQNTPLDPEKLKETADAMAVAADKLSTDPAVPALEKKISDRLGNMAGPRIPITPKLGFVSSAPEELVRAIRLFVDAERKQPIASASLGSANVVYLALLVELLDQQREARTTIETILAVEEPEAHLHVTMQRRLFRYLLRNEPALVLTTHSPHIASVAPLKSIVLLRSTPSGTKGTSTASISMDPRDVSDLERYLDVSRAEMLFASFVILVEGISEVYLLPAIAEAYGFDLDGQGVVVANIHGTDFSPYVKLLGNSGLDIPYAIVTDGDSSPNKRGTADAGLKRAFSTQAGSDGAELLKRLAALDPRSENYANDRGELVAAAKSRHFYVGTQTLEVDLAEVLGREIDAAFKELEESINARDDVSKGTKNELESEPDPDLRKSYLKRFKPVGKGRFSQRLAAHISSLAFHPGRNRGSDEVSWGRAQYIYDALESASYSVRNQPLVGPIDNFGYETEA